MASGVVRAQQVAPLVPLFEKPAPEALILRFHMAMAKGLSSGGLKVMDHKLVRDKLQLGLVNAGCFEGLCVSNARTALGLERLATTKIDKVGKNYMITVRLYKGDKIFGSGSGRCDICTLTEAVNTMVRVAEELGTRGEEPPDVVAPPKPVPVPVPVPVVQPKPALEPKPKPAPVVEPEPEPVVKDEEGKPWPLWPALVAGGVGLVGLGVGIPLLVMDGKGVNCRGEARPDGTNCTDLYKTAAGGWIATGIGIGALAASGVLFYLYWSSRPKEQQAARVEQILFGPAPSGGFVLGAAGRF